MPSANPGGFFCIMETLNITSDQFLQALAWINGQASILGEKEVLLMLRSLNDAFRENCRRLRPGPIPRFRPLGTAPLSLSSILSEVLEKEKAAAPSVALPAADRQAVDSETQHVKVPVESTRVPLTPEQEVMALVEQESRLDSVLLINSIAHVSAAAGYPVTQSRAQIILYCLYGTRLGAGKERLEIEHPQMWRYGPVFPRAFKKGSIGDQIACEESYRELMAREPALLTALSIKTRAMMATPMADLNAVHKGPRSPFGRMLARYPDQWGTRIPDEDIADYFRKASG